MPESRVNLRLLFVGASSDEAANVVSALAKGGYEIKAHCAYNFGSFDLHLRQNPLDLILWFDMRSRFTLRSGLQSVLRAKSLAPLIEIKDRVTEADRVKALALGACDVVTKSNGKHLLMVVERELSALAAKRKQLAYQGLYRESQRLCHELMQSSRNCVAFVQDGRLVQANPTFRQLFGYSYVTELGGLPLVELVDPPEARRLKDFLVGLERSGGTGEIEVRATGPGGAQFRAGLAFAKASVNEKSAFRVIARNLSRRQDVERQASRFDPLTQLINHQHFLELLETDVNATHAHGGRSVLLLVELEHLRTIRDTVGIAGSDLVIRELADVVQNATLSSHTLARFADHTFTLFVPECTVDDALLLAETIRLGVETHISDCGGQSVSATCSIGVVEISRMTANAQDALTQADIACRTAIHSGGNRVQVYEATDYNKEPQVRSVVRGAELREALTEHRMSLSFSPIVSLHGDMAEVYQVGLEMLDEFGNVLDHETILSAARDSDLSEDVDRCLVEQTILMMTNKEMNAKTTSLFVRLSDESIKEPSTALHLGRLLKQSKVNASLLIFEVSESMASGQLRYARGFVNTIKRFGCKAALARFGAGSNSLRSLKHLNVDFVKIDESVIEDLIENAEHQKTIRAIQEAARLSNKATIAPQVHDANSLALLWEMGVSYVQGDYVQGPIIELSHNEADGKSSDFNVVH